MGKTTVDKGSGRIAVINAVKTPLNFFVLVVLVVEGGLGGLALKSPENMVTIIYLMVAVLVALVAAVVAIAFAKPELMSAAEASTGAKRLVDGIAGHWWQELSEPLSVSFVEISPNPGTGTVRMTGQVYSQRGFAGTWETTAACVNVDERKVFYSWKGQFRSRPGEPYEGFGEISFHESLDGGEGLFLDVNLSNPMAVRKATRFSRASKEELQSMRKGGGQTA